jgi:hypothetical protein
MSGRRKPELATAKIISGFQKIFLDTNRHFGDHDLVIAIQMTASIAGRGSRTVAAGQLELPQGNYAVSPARAIVEFGS